MSIILTNGFEVTIFQAFLPYFSRHKVHIWDVKGGKRNFFGGEILNVQQDEYEVTLLGQRPLEKRMEQIFIIVYGPPFTMNLLQICL